MGHEVHFVGITGEDQPDRPLEVIARGRRTVVVIDVLRELPARCPGEEDRNGRHLRVVDDLSEAVEPLREHGVVAVNEEEDAPLPLGQGCQLRVQRLHEGLVPVEVTRLTRHEVGLGIARCRRRPLDLADLMIGRNGNGDPGEIKPLGPLTVEQRP